MAVGSGVVTMTTWSAVLVKERTLRPMPAPVGDRDVGCDLAVREGLEDARALELVSSGGEGRAGRLESAGGQLGEDARLVLCAALREHGSAGREAIDDDERERSGERQGRRRQR